MYLLVNRKDIIVDKLDEVRYIKLQPTNNIVIACKKNEAIGVIGSDCTTHYPLISTDTTNAENAVRIIELKELPEDFMINHFILAENGDIIRRFTIEEYQNLK